MTTHSSNIVTTLRIDIPNDVDVERARSAIGRVIQIIEKGKVVVIDEAESADAVRPVAEQINAGRILRMRFEHLARLLDIPKDPIDESAPENVVKRVEALVIGHEKMCDAVTERDHGIAIRDARITELERDRDRVGKAISGLARAVGISGGMLAIDQSRAVHQCAATIHFDHDARSFKSTDRGIYTAPVPEFPEAPAGGEWMPQLVKVDGKWMVSVGPEYEVTLKDNAADELVFDSRPKSAAHAWSEVNDAYNSAGYLPPRVVPPAQEPAGGSHVGVDMRNMSFIYNSADGSKHAYVHLKVPPEGHRWEPYVSEDGLHWRWMAVPGEQPARVDKDAVVYRKVADAEPESERVSFLRKNLSALQRKLNALEEEKRKWLDINRQQGRVIVERDEQITRFRRDLADRNARIAVLEKRAEAAETELVKVKIELDLKENPGA